MSATKVQTSRSQATVVITTKNRVVDLCKSIASALNQTARPNVLVIDDGSTDGTTEIVRERFPTVQISRSETSRGLIVQRNRAAQMVETPIIFSIDDDAEFSSPTVVEATLSEFNHPRVGAVSIPFVDINRSPNVCGAAPDRRQVYACYDYVGTAHALRRDIFQALGGYREILFHQGEEEDYCARMLDAGFVTRAGNADPIHHYESPRRSYSRMDFFGARNKVLYAWHNVPFPYLMAHLAATTVFTAAYSRHARRIVTRMRGVIAAYGTIALLRTVRRPVSGATYGLSRELKSRRYIPLEMLEKRLSQESRSLYGAEPLQINQSA